MPRNKVKAVTVGLMAEDDADEMFMVVPMEASGHECIEWATSDGQTDLPVLCIVFSLDDAQTIADLWNASVSMN